MLVRCLDQLECGFLLADGKVSGPETIRWDVLSLGKPGELTQEPSWFLHLPDLRTGPGKVCQDERHPSRGCQRGAEHGYGFLGTG